MSCCSSLGFYGFGVWGLEMGFKGLRGVLCWESMAYPGSGTVSRSFAWTLCSGPQRCIVCTGEPEHAELCFGTPAPVGPQAS